MPSTTPSGYAVVDVETTGFSPRLGDRVVELAVVHLDPSGRVTGRWETVLNPERDLGPTRIHGIRGADVARAPRFADIAAQLVELLDGRLLVAHNAGFDLRFLRAELAAGGYELPEALIASALCTMRLARDFVPGAGRSLRDCCAAYDIELGDAHRASVDALATAHLFAAYLAASPYPESWARLLGSAARLDPHPSGPATAIAATWMARPASAAAPVTASDFLARISERLPDYSGPAEHLDYLALLDRCLLDRRLTGHESDSLALLAEESGIGRRGAATLHRRFFDDLAGAAWADGVLTHHELADLTEVATLLEIPAAALAEATDPRSWALRRIHAAHAASGGIATSSAAPRRGRHRLGGDGDELFRLEPGDAVVLTGQMSRPRGELESELRSLGLVVNAGVSRSTRLLVASDPDSLSGKARKARDYGVAIVAEEALAAMLARLGGRRLGSARSAHAVA